MRRDRNTKMRHKGRGTARRVAATMGALAMAAFAAAGLATTAAAAPGNLPTEAGSLTIHKFEQPSPAGAANNSGEAIPVPGGWVALAGVGFDIQPITDIDLTTDQGWNLAAQYAADPALATQLGTTTSVITGADGTIAQTLPMGAYLVTEKQSPNATTVPAGEPANITMIAAPFVITVPVPTDNGTWNSDVHVYPKNSVTSVEKSVGSPSEVGVGATLPWTISVKIPTLAAGEQFTSFEITDALDAKIAYVAGSATLSIDGADVSFADATAGQSVSINVTALDLLAAHQGKTLILTFDTTVLEAGEIVNTADIFINDPNHQHGITTNPATSYWGAIEILKHAKGDVTKTLEGAKFTVHATEADALAGTNPIEVDGEFEFTTGADGTVLISGLFVSNSAGETRTYYLHETQAPAGYDLVGTPIQVTLTAGSDVATPVEVAVPNPQKPNIGLPLTGGAGTVALSMTGLLLVGAGSLVAIAAQRRRSSKI